MRSPVFTVRFPLVVLSALLIFGLPEIVNAAIGGRISGTVEDSSKALIPTATVSATNLDTGVRHAATTNTTGAYSLPNLPVGRYNVDISAPGFRPYRRAGVLVDVNSDLLVDAVLQLGERSDSVTVTESAVRAETASTQLG